MFSDAGHGVENRAQKRKRERDAQAGEAITGLPDHLVISHIFRSGYFNDPADLARLPAVSREMRDAVAATGLHFEEINKYRAVRIGCVSAVERLQRRGNLSRRERLCEAAARSGQLEKLKEFREIGWPWNKNDVLECGAVWASRDAAVGARERL